MKKYRYEMLIVLLTAIIFNIATLFLPPNFRGLSFYSFLFVIDVAVLALFSTSVSLKGMKRRIFLTFYWIPFSMLTLIVLTSIFIPFPDWNTAVKIFVLTLLFASLIANFIFKIFVLLSWLVSLFCKNKKWTSTFLSIGAILSACLFIICAIAPFYWAVYPKVVPIEISSKTVPEAFSGFKIVQISDLHCDFFRNEKPLQRTVDSIKALKPDLILITGDIVTYKADEMNRFFDVLKQIEAPYGVFCVMGNHDYGTYYRWKTEEQSVQNLNKLFENFERLHWRLLRNESVFLVKGNDSIALAGTENQCLKKTHYPCDGDINLTLQNVPEQYSVILMTHDPVYWEKDLVTENRSIFLTLSGHTHGLQIGWRAKRSQWGLYRIFNEYWGGMYEKNERYLYINTGLGTVGFPFRIGLNPEITLITIKAANP